MNCYLLSIVLGLVLIEHSSPKNFVDVPKDLISGGDEGQTFNPPLPATFKKSFTVSPF